VAKVITEVCSPAVVVVLLPLAVGWSATGHRIGPTLGWAVVVALFSSVLPMAFIIRGARRGRWDGHHVRNREGRLVPLSLGLASTAVGLVILLGGGAPRAMVALDGAMLVTLIGCLVITRWWKISLHAAVASGAVVLLALLYGPWLLLLGVLVVLICWSRTALADHTTAQVLAGAAIAPVLGGAVFLLIR
jgi:membrane-associated phospholipid phosphatase